MTIFLRWIINAVALLAITQVIPGFSVQNFYFALVIALILGLVNAIIRPVLLFITLPINIITLGLFTFVINAALLWFVSTFVKGFYIHGFVPAIAAAIVLWAVSTLTNWLIKQAKKT